MGKPTPSIATAMENELQYLIGNTAGQIWNYLESHGDTTAIRMKAALGISNSLLYLALGWLAREDKVDITPSATTFTISLKRP